MANYHSDLRNTIARVSLMEHPEEQVRILTDALWKMEEELEYVLKNLGRDNFSEEGLRELARAVKGEM